MALEKLVKSNLRYVVSVAKQYQSRGLNLHDLINKDHPGLVKAATKFDKKRDFKFISHAFRRIRQGIIQALSEKLRMVRLCMVKINVVTKINQVSSHFEPMNQRPPKAEEIVELDSSLSEIRLCPKHSSWPISMDESLKNEEGGFNLYDLIRSESSISPEQNLIKISLKLEIDNVMGMLSYREAIIIKMYFGIGADTMGLKQIALNLDLTAERVRQIKLKALTRLRNSSKVDCLKEYLK